MAPYRQIDTSPLLESLRLGNFRKTNEADSSHMYTTKVRKTNLPTLAITLSTRGAHPLFKLLNQQGGTKERTGHPHCNSTPCLTSKIRRKPASQHNSKGSPLTFLLLHFFHRPFPKLRCIPKVARRSTVALVHAGPSSLSRLSLSDFFLAQPGSALFIRRFFIRRLCEFGFGF